MGDQKRSYLLHVQNDCKLCLAAKAILEHYSIEYTTTTDSCDEWPTVPAVYQLDGASKELVGGYEQLGELLLQDEG